MVKPAGSRAMTNNGVPTLRFYGQHGAKPRRELVAKRGGPFLQDYNILQFLYCSSDTILKKKDANFEKNVLICDLATHPCKGLYSSNKR